MTYCGAKIFIKFAALKFFIMISVKKSLVKGQGETNK